MAEKSETTVEVEDDGVVTLELPEGFSEEALKGLGNVQEVVVEPKKKEETTTAKTTGATAVDEAATQLKTQLEASQKRAQQAEATANAERQRADEALRLAARHEQEASTAREDADKVRLERIDADIATQTRLLESAKAELKRAMEAAEFDKVADAQVAIAEASSTKAQLAADKRNIEAGAARKKTETTEGRVVQQQTQDPAAIFEGYVSRFAPPAAKWLREHPECVPPQVGGDAVANAKMMLGHEEAKRKGYALNSAEYFEEIERHTGHRKEEATVTTETKTGDEGVTSKAAQVTKATPRPSAPVVRDGGPSVGDGARKNTRSVTLSEAQKEAARFTYPHLDPKKAYALYAEGYIQSVADGKIGRLTH